MTTLCRSWLYPPVRDLWIRLLDWGEGGRGVICTVFWKREGRFGSPALPGAAQLQASDNSSCWYQSMCAQTAVITKLNPWASFLSTPAVLLGIDNDSFGSRLLGGGVTVVSSGGTSFCQSNKGKSQLRMRSSLVVRAFDCQCTSCNGPGFDPSIRRHSGIWGAAWSSVEYSTKKIKNPPPQKKKNIKRQI